MSAPDERGDGRDARGDGRDARGSSEAERALGRTRVVLVTGLSGAGKSTALHVLEDLGYYCVDSLPPALARGTVELCEQADVRRVGLCIDVRVGAFLEGAVEALKELEASDRDVTVLFLDASDEAIARRFSETRRPHPLASQAKREGDSKKSIAVLEGVQIERERLARLRALATLDLDTSSLHVHELRRKLIVALGATDGDARAPHMAITIVSFGFKYGVPLDANLLFDVRFLDNPYFVPELRPLSGRDERVRASVLANLEARDLLTHVERLVSFSLPRYEREGRSYLTLAIGCTGGRHRSVVLAIELARRIESELGRPVVVQHRDVDRPGSGQRGDDGSSGDRSRTEPRGETP